MATSRGQGPHRGAGRQEPGACGVPSECGSSCAPRGAAPWRLQRERRQPAAPVLQLRPSLQGGCRSPESPPIGSPAALGPPLRTTATAKPPADTTHLFNQSERLHPPHSVAASEKQGPRRALHAGSAAILGTELVKSLLQIPTPAFLSEKIGVCSLHSSGAIAQLFFYKQ